MKRAGLAAAVALALSTLLSGVASANPSAGLGAMADAAAAAGTLVQPVHGCHRYPAIGPEVGECHIHVSRWGSPCLYERVPMHHCRRGYYDGESYSRRYRAPRCWTECKYVGPIKVCDQVCR